MNNSYNQPTLNQQNLSEHMHLPVVRFSTMQASRQGAAIFKGAKFLTRKNINGEAQHKCTTIVTQG